MGNRYRLETTSRRVEREIERLPLPDRDRVITAIRALTETPRPYGVKQLEPGIYRMRVGSYRVIYQVRDDEQLVLVGRVVRKSERTYRRWQQLFEEPQEYDAAPATSAPDAIASG